MSPLPLWIQYCQALAVPVIALAGVAIAAAQLFLAGVRLRHDLYDRRLKVFEAVKRLLAGVFANGKISPAEFYQYVQGTAEATFLLNDRTVKYLEKIRERAAKMMLVETRLQNQNLTDEARGKLADQEAELLTWFTSQPDTLVGIFKPLMQLNGPWVLSRKWPFVAFGP
jgi:hypothetical protein